MANFTVTRQGAGAWLFTATGTANFKWYKDGLEIAETADEYLRIDNGADEPPQLECLDSTEGSSTPNSVTYAPYAVLQWRRSSNATGYKVEAYESAAWTHKAWIYQHDDMAYYRYETRTLTDVTTAQWRVIPVDAQEREGNPIQMDFFVCRQPDTPSVSYTYDSGTGEVTVSAA